MPCLKMHAGLASLPESVKRTGPVWHVIVATPHLIYDMQLELQADVNTYLACSTAAPAAHAI